jgi:uncharacterized membrane protein YkvA (DUF1232 family)
VTEARLEIEVSGREQRLYDRVRTKLAGAPGVDGSAGVRDLLLLLPDLAVLLARLLRDRRVPLGARLIAGAALAYVLSPVDVMPEFLFGPLGILDDVVIAAAAVSRLLNHVHPDLIAAHWSGRSSALEAVRRVTGWAEARVSDRFMRLLGFRRV